MKKLKPILIKECIDVLPGAKQAQIGTKWHLNIPFRQAMCPDKNDSGRTRTRHLWDEIGAQTGTHGSTMFKKT